jgi:hypothetical protein
MPAPLVKIDLEFSYARSVGPVISAYLDGLQERRLLASRAPSGRRRGWTAARPSTRTPASPTRGSRSTSPSSTSRSAGTSPCGWRATLAAGGVLSSNPIGASGMIRFAEAALQVQGKAGEHQIEGARIGLAHAYGAMAQYFAMAVLSASPSPW